MKKYLELFTTGIILILLPMPSIADVIKVPVLKSEPVYTNSRVYNTPTRTCKLREIDSAEESFDLFGGVIGALAGHVITRKISGSSVNRALGTAAGAMIGSKISNRSNDKQLINDCTITNSYHMEKVISGYNVTYMLNNKEEQSFFTYDPGHTISISVNRSYTVLK